MPDAVLSPAQAILVRSGDTTGSVLFVLNPAEMIVTAPVSGSPTATSRVDPAGSSPVHTIRSVAPHELTATVVAAAPGTAATAPLSATPAPSTSTAVLPMIRFRAMIPPPSSLHTGPGPVPRCIPIGASNVWTCGAQPPEAP